MALQCGKQDPQKVRTVPRGYKSKAETKSWVIKWKENGKDDGQRGSIKSDVIKLHHKENKEKSCPDDKCQTVISRKKWGREKSYVLMWISRWFPDMLSVSRTMWSLSSSLSAWQKGSKSCLQLLPDFPFCNKIASCLYPGGQGKKP